MKEIQSAKNPRIKELKNYIKKIIGKKRKNNLLEGFHLIEEAASSDAEIKELFVTQRGRKEWGDWLAANKGISTFLVSDEVMDAVSDLPTPQGILAVMALTAEARQIFQEVGCY